MFDLITRSHRPLISKLSVPNEVVRCPASDHSPIDFVYGKESEKTGRDKNYDVMYFDLCKTFDKELNQML